MMKLISFIALFFATTLTFAQENELINKLDSVTNLIDYNVNVAAGTSVLITKGNETFYTASNGLSSIELNAQNTINTTYDLASGVKNWTYLIHQMGWSNEDKISTDQLLRAIYAQKTLAFVPGEKYKYSNSGYVLLTKVIENATGQSFVQWTNENIFVPLEMTNTFFNDNQNKVIKGMASAYRFDSNGNAIREAYNTSALGSSSLISNAVDMAKWMKFLLHPPEDKKAILAIMFSTSALNDGSKNNYAYGIEIDSYNGIKLIGHDGSWSSFTSNMVIVPDHKIGIFFANNYRVGTRAILEFYLDVFFPQESQETTAHTSSSPEEEEVIVSKKILEKYLGTYRLGDAWYLDITLKGDDLYTRANGENAFYMKPINDSTFLVRNYGNRTITFNATPKGEIHQLTYSNIEAKRKTSSFYFNEKEFKKYEGVYYSTELDRLFQIRVDENKMYYTNIKNGTYKLIYENGKLFFSDGYLSKITFDYNDQNLVTGFHKVNSKGKKLFHFKKAS